MAYHQYEYYLVRTLTIVSIVGLILISVYQLSITLELCKKFLDHIEEADAMFAKNSVKNLTLSKLMFEPMQRNARLMLDKHEPAIITNIALFTSLIAISIAGLIVAIRKHYYLMLTYGILLDIIYCLTFLHCSRVQIWFCCYIVFVSIMAYFRAYHIKLNRSKHNSKVQLIQNTERVCDKL